MKTPRLRRRTYGKDRKRRGGPIPALSYDPLDTAENMHKFLNQLITWTLSGRIRPRQASVCRAILATSLDVEGYGELEGKIDEIGELLTGASNILERAKLENPESHEIVKQLTEAEQLELYKLIKRYEELVAKAQERAGVSQLAKTSGTSGGDTKE